MLKHILLALFSASAMASESGADTFLINTPTQQTYLVGCTSEVLPTEDFPQGVLYGWCQDDIPTDYIEPMTGLEPMIPFAAIGGQFVHWTSMCVLVSHTIGTLGEDQYKINCDDVIFRGRFE